MRKKKKKMETRLKEKSRDGCTFNLYLSYSKAPDNERPIDCTFIHCDFFLNEIVSWSLGVLTLISMALLGRKIYVSSRTMVSTKRKERTRRYF